jgi:hypothetical protein
VQVRTNLSLGVALGQARTDPGGIVPHDIKLLSLQLGKEPLPSLIYLLPLAEHPLILLRLEEARVDVILHQLVDLILKLWWVG